MFLTIRPTRSVMDFLCCSECYPWGRVHCDAKRATESCDRVRGREPDPLRWCLSSASVSLADRVQERGGHGYPLGPAEQPLQRGRDAARPAVPYDPGTRTDRDDSVTAAERRVPVPHGAARLSKSVHAAAILAAHGANGAAPVAQAARSLPRAYDRATTPAVATDLRCRLDRARALWKAGAGQDRLQPHQAGATIVSPAARPRGPQQGLLAWRVAARGRPYGQRDARPPCRLLREDPGRGPVGDRPRGQRVLRPQADRVAGGAQGWLCDRRPLDQPHQIQTAGPAVRESQSRGRGGRVPLPAYSLASSLSVRRDPSPPARRVDRPVDTLQTGQVPLPGPRHESAVATPQPLALLQRARRGRAAHQTAQGGLCPGQHPDPALP